MKYLISISEAELDAQFEKNQEFVMAQQRMWRMQLIAFFAAFLLLAGVAFLQTHAGSAHYSFFSIRHIVLGLLGLLALLIAGVTFLNSNKARSLVAYTPSAQDKNIDYDIDLNDSGLSIVKISKDSRETTEYFWTTIKKVYLFNNSIMILGYSKAKEYLLLPFEGPASDQAMQHLVDELQQHLPASIFVNA